MDILELPVKKRLGRVKYKDSLMVLKNFALRDLAASMLISLPSGATKEVMAETIANEVIAHPEILVKAAFHYELKAILDYATGRQTPLELGTSGMADLLDNFKVFYIEGPDIVDAKIYLCKDVADKILPLIPAELERREKNGALLAEKLFLGSANICGSTSLAYFHDHYYAELIRRISIPNKEMTVEDEKDIFHTIFARTFIYTKRKVRGSLLSPLSFIAKHEIEYPVNHDYIPPKPEFDTVLAFGEMPYPQFNFHGAEDLKEIVFGFECPFLSPEFYLRSVYMAQQCQQGIDAIEAMAYFGDYAIEHDVEIVDAIMKFQDHQPFWFYNGRSAYQVESEIRAKRKARRRSRHSSMNHIVPQVFDFVDEFLDADEEEQHEIIESTHTPFVHKPGEKIGRNDPCPCGSGKKFKNCHGRFQ